MFKRVPARTPRKWRCCNNYPCLPSCGYNVGRAPEYDEPSPTRAYREAAPQAKDDEWKNIPSTLPSGAGGLCGFSGTFSDLQALQAFDAARLYTGDLAYVQSADGGSGEYFMLDKASNMIPDGRSVVSARFDHFSGAHPGRWLRIASVP